MTWAHGQDGWGLKSPNLLERSARECSCERAVLLPSLFLAFGPFLINLYGFGLHPEVRNEQVRTPLRRHSQVLTAVALVALQCHQPDPGTWG